MDEFVFIYDETKNPDKVHLDGVPLRSLTKADFEALPDQWKAAVKQQPFYVPVSVKPSKKEGN